MSRWTLEEIRKSCRHVGIGILMKLWPGSDIVRRKVESAIDGYIRNHAGLDPKLYQWRVIWLEDDFDVEIMERSAVEQLGDLLTPIERARMALARGLEDGRRLMEGSVSADLLAVELEEFPP